MFSKYVKGIKMKKGQIGETITWFVATIIIIIVLTVLIVVVTSFYGDFKGIKKTTTSVDVLASKSFFSWVLTEDGGDKMIYEQLQEEDNLNDFNGLLAEKIFKNFYSEEYKKVWVGTVNIPVFPRYNSNNFFGEDPGHVKELSPFVGMDISLPYVTQRIKLNKGGFVMGEENKYVEMTLTNPN